MIVSSEGHGASNELCDAFLKSRGVPETLLGLGLRGWGGNPSYPHFLRKTYTGVQWKLEQKFGKRKLCVILLAPLNIFVTKQTKVFWSAWVRSASPSDVTLLHVP